MYKWWVDWKTKIPALFFFTVLSSSQETRRAVSFYDLNHIRVLFTFLYIRRRGRWRWCLRWAATSNIGIIRWTRPMGSTCPRDDDTLPLDINLPMTKHNHKQPTSYRGNLLSYSCSKNYKTTSKLSQKLILSSLNFLRALLESFKL